MHTYYKEPLASTYIKKALAKIDLEMRLPVGENSDIFIDQLSEFTDNISETSVEEIFEEEKRKETNTSSSPYSGRALSPALDDHSPSHSH